MDEISVPENLPELVSEKFQAAKQAGDLLFWDSEVALLDLNGIPTDPLEASDLAAVYAVIHAYTAAGQRLFGFFNSGANSGASQPHRHVQFLPVEAMRTGLVEGQMWELLVDRLKGAGREEIPFVYFSAPIEHKATPRQLLETYRALWKLARYAVEKYGAGEGGGADAEMSYNMAFTEETMVILPRRAEGVAVPTGLPEPGPRETGVVALNGTVLGGTLLVKDVLEWEALRGDGGKLGMVLEGIGIPFAAFRGEILGWKAGGMSFSL